MDDQNLNRLVITLTEERLFRPASGGFTMDDIARDAGISKKTLYRIFPSRRELIMTVVDRQLSRVEAAQKEIVRDSNLEFPDKLKKLLKNVSDVLKKADRGRLREILRLTPEVWPMIRRRRLAILGIMTGILEEGRREGYVRKDIPADFLSRYFLLVTDNAVTPEAVEEQNIPPGELLEQTVTLLLHGVLTEKGKNL